MTYIKLTSYQNLRVKFRIRVAFGVQIRNRFLFERQIRIRVNSTRIQNPSWEYSTHPYFIRWLIRVACGVHRQFDMFKASDYVVDENYHFSMLTRSHYVPIDHVVKEP